MKYSVGSARLGSPSAGESIGSSINTRPGRLSRRRRVQLTAAMASVLIATTACGGSDSSTTSSAVAVTTLAPTAETTIDTAPTAVADTTATADTTASADTAVETTVTSDSGAATTTDATPAIVAAANTFLDKLTADERDAVLFDFSDTAQRQLWSNLPEGLFQRDGLMWGNLDEDSQQALLGVLQALLSDAGYEQVYGEWHADDALQGGGNLTFGSDYYWVAIIGEPSETDAWQFQFGGHHITVNATIKSSDISLTPSFIGVQPAVYDSDGNEIRPLGTIEDDAFALVGSLDDSQASTAVLGNTLIDLILGPGQDGKTVENQGIAGADLTDEQKALLISLISHYGGLVNEEDAAARMATLTAEIDQTYFAWYGPTDPADTSGIYFRVTGPSIVIEYSGQQMGGSASDHIHGIYRDPTNDYGAAFGAGLS
jgi:hypothetical protein